VGIGASAGGLEAMQKLFPAIAKDSGMAYVVVTHQMQEHENLLTELIGKMTSLTVVTAHDAMRIEKNTVYVTPPGSNIELKENKLFLSELIVSPGSPPLPIDFFFRSLAQEMKAQAIAIILSGMGSDGTIGQQAVKAAFGISMVQDPRQAKFDSMPKSAIAGGLADYVLPVEAMPAQLMAYSLSFHEAKNEDINNMTINDNLEKIFFFLHRHTGNNFSSYKKNTLCRRIERRMIINHIGDSRRYVEYLENNPHEIDLLFKELLIGVTCFFRDPAAFTILTDKALPELLSHKNNGDCVRIWIPGCSTGEEVYSFAILIHEYMEREHISFHVQIYGTDLDSSAIAQARKGIYPQGIALDITSARLQKFFTLDEGYYRIKKHIREMVVFAPHNVVQDPPFIKLDLISCRNLMIYLDTSLQKQLIPLFHYSLNPKGILFLGSSETIGSFSDLFTTIEQRWKIFLRKDTTFPVHYPAQHIGILKKNSVVTMSPLLPLSKETKLPIAELIEQKLLKAHVPPTVIVNGQGDVFFIHGRTGAYLEPAPGHLKKPQNILVMAREGLKRELSSVIREALVSSDNIRRDAIKVKTNNHICLVNVSAKRIDEPDTLSGFIMITFEAVDEHPPTLTEVPPVIAEKPEITEYSPEQEFLYIKENLQLKINELETSNEELKSANEELQSTNEELQSVSEELETSREELQSLNEEMHSVNSELEMKNTDLACAHDDMTNLLNSTGIATIFLDQELNIKRFTMQAKKIIHLIASDVGRPLGDIATELEYYSIIEDARKVLDSLVFKEVEVKTKNDIWYLMRILPYRTAENVINGITITFVDITKIKNTEFLLATRNEALELLAKGQPITDILDALLRIIEQQSPGILCSVMLLSDNGKCLRHGAAPSLPYNFNMALDKTEISPTTAIAAAMAVYRREAVIFDDIEKEPSLKEFYGLAKEYGIYSVWSQPIFSIEGKIFGTFTMYTKTRHHHESLLKLMNEATSLLGITISQELMDQKNYDLASEIKTK
jgi:two-component system CheB/CheR fusion protein